MCDIDCMMLDVAWVVVESRHQRDWMGASGWSGDAGIVVSCAEVSARLAVVM